MHHFFHMIPFPCFCIFYHNWAVNMMDCSSSFDIAEWCYLEVTLGDLTQTPFTADNIQLSTAKWNFPGSRLCSLPIVVRLWLPFPSSLPSSICRQQQEPWQPSSSRLGRPLSASPCPSAPASTHLGGLHWAQFGVSRSVLFWALQKWTCYSQYT